MARGKKKTAKRGTRTVVKHASKAISKGRMKAARNECCPVIYKICTPVTKTVKKWVSDGADGGYDRTDKVNVGVKCRVDFGKRHFGGKGRGTLTPDEADKKVSELTNVLEAKRCKALVENTKKKPAKVAAVRSPSGASISSWLGL